MVLGEGLGKYAVLPSQNISPFVRRLMDEYHIYGPTERRGKVEFDEVLSPNDLRLEYSTTYLPPKKLFLPIRETLFTYEITDEGVRIVHDYLRDLEEGKGWILLGIHACDLHGLLYLDKVFTSKFQDPYYITRRKNTTIVCVTCRQPMDWCFCTSTGTGPTIDHDFDLLMTNIGGDYFVEFGSRRGKALVEPNADLFREATRADHGRRKEEIEEASRKVPRRVSLDGIYQKLVKVFDSDLWDEYGRRGVACGKCNFVCPTCYCFDVLDEMDLDGRRGERVKVWDSCHFLSFARVAGGNFRESRTSRIKQRIYHKFCYTIDEYGLISCVACGRCIWVCPPRFDLVEIINEVNEVSR